MVISGHTFQYTGYGEGYLDLFPFNIFTLIQMPQFMFISGFVSYKSIETASAKYIFKTRWQSLLRPMITYCAFIFGLSVLYGISQLSLLGFAKACAFSYWFIWAVIYALIFMLVSRRLFKLNIVLITLLSFIISFIPVEYVPLPGFTFFRSLLLFFVIGFYCKQQDLLRKIYNNCKYLLPAIAIVFVLCLILYSGKNSFYFFSRMNPLEHIQYFTLMLAAGLSGISICYCLIRLYVTKCKENKFIMIAGRYTFAMYMIQGVVFSAMSYCNIALNSYLLSWLLALGIFVAINVLIKFLKRFRFTSAMLLGKVA